MKVQSPSDDTAETSHAAPRGISRLWIVLVATAIAVAGISFAVVAFTGPSPAAASGDRLVFLAPDAEGTLQVFAVDGDETEQLTQASGDVLQVEWAVDGSAIAYAVVSGDELADVHVMDPHGSNDRLACRECAQVLSVQGSTGPARHVASREMTAIHVSTGGDVVKVAINYGDIVIHDSSRPGDPIVIERGDGIDDRDFRWSPDGEHLAFASRHPGAYNVPSEPQLDGIYVVDADGSNLRQVTHPPGPPYTHGADAQPVWSPDATTIAFSRYLAEFEPGSRLESPGWSEIWTVGLDGAPELKLTATTELGGDFGATSPEWSRDGSRIAFLFDQDASPEDTGINETDIGVIASDGTDLRLLFSCLDDDSYRRCPGRGSLDWSGDGSTLGFQSVYTGMVFLLPADGGPLRRATQTADACCVRWQPGAA